MWLSSAFRAFAGYGEACGFHSKSGAEPVKGFERAVKGSGPEVSPANLLQAAEEGGVGTVYS